MQKSNAPHVELDRARKAIETMSCSKSLDDFEEAWKEFLRRIERAFNKIMSHYGRSPKWGPWYGKYKNLRTKDALLSYLTNARGADEHTVEEIVARENPKVSFDGVNSNSIHLSNVIIRGGKILSFEAPDGVSVKFYPQKIRPLPVINRSVRYDVPKNHLGENINGYDVLTMAGLGVRFYENTLSSAEEYFVK